MILALGLLEGLWLAVFFDQAVAPIDITVVGAVVSLRSPALVAVATLVTDAGSPAVMVVLLAVTTGVLAWRHRTKWPLALAAAGLTALTVVDLGMKSLISRPRPPQAWHSVAAGGWSFPSGHAVFSAGVLLLVIWLLAPRRLLVAAAALVTLAVGCSRVVLGVHYPSDVLAGWCLAVVADGGLILTTVLIQRRLTRRTEVPASATPIPVARTSPDSRKAA